MKYFLVAGLLLSLCLHAGDVRAASEEKAIVILSASIVEGDREIKNICLMRKVRCEYFAPSEKFLEIEPGSYKLWNVDFTDNEKSGRGNVHFKKIEYFKFRAKRLYFIGRLELARVGGKYEMNINQDTSLLLDACKHLPKSAMKYRFANASTGKEIDLTCEKILDTAT